MLNRFRSIAEACGFETSDKELRFPERTVLNVYASRGAITQTLSLLNEVAEIRRAKDTAEFFDAMSPPEQREWVEDLLERTIPAEDGSIRICLLDTGVNRGHPLLAQHIDEDDLYTVNSNWGLQMWLATVQGWPVSLYTATFSTRSPAKHLSRLVTAWNR